jgi:hypothetical protein
MAVDGPFGAVGYGVNAVALPVYWVDGAIGVTSGRRATLTADFPDGASNTILLAEKYQVYADNGYGYPLPNDWSCYYQQVDEEGLFGKTALIEDMPPPAMANAFNVQSTRKGTILVSLLDGSARSLRISIDQLRLWPGLLDPKDGLPVGDW